MFFSISVMPSPAQGEAAAKPLLRQIQQLDREVGGHWQRVLEEAGRGPLPEQPEERRRVAGDPEGLRARLTALESRAHRLPEAEGRLVLDKLRLIGWALGNLEKVASGLEPPVERSENRIASALEVQPLAAPVVASNSCSDAPVIGNGTFSGTTAGATNDGSSSCGSSSLSPDVWFRYDYEVLQTRRISVDTFGSGFDTVLSVWAACPGAAGYEITCNDDASGLQSATSFQAFAGNSYWIRVSGFDGATGPFQLQVGTGGIVTGRVTRVDNGDPVPSGFVRAKLATPGYFFQSAGPLEADGTYAVAGLFAGSYSVRTENLADLLDEVWNDQPCTGGELCDLEAGDPVWVNSLGTTQGIDFVLAAGGAITGTVVVDTTGDPMSGADISVWTLAGDHLVASAVSGSDGSYTVSGLATGSYRVEVDQGLQIRLHG